MSLVLVPTRAGDAPVARSAPAPPAASRGSGWPVGSRSSASARRAAVADARGAGRAGRGGRTRRLRAVPRRVPVRPGQRRHATDNRVEGERARHALALAAGGARVAVVSSGDPGIFAMASAVLEALDEDADAHATSTSASCPGLSAMQAAAARVGAPLGHDFCVISLSDQLKPWDVDRAPARRGRRAADLALALYNPASKHAARAARAGARVLLRHRAAGDAGRGRARGRARRRSPSRSRRSATLDLGRSTCGRC